LLQTKQFNNLAMQQFNRVMAEEKQNQEEQTQEEQTSEEETKQEEQTSGEEAQQEEQAQESTSTEEEEVEVPEKFQSLVSQIEQMSVLDLSELVKILEKKFGVSAAAPVAAAGAAPADGGGEAQEEKTEFDVEISDPGSNKINVIKAVRSITDMGLKDAKELVDNTPSVVKEGVKKEDAEQMKGQLEEAGATVTLK